MGKWKGEADAAAETAGGGGGNKFPAAPRGIYTIQVADFTEGKTKETNRDKVDLQCEIANEGEYLGRRVYVTITHIPKGEKGHGIMIHTLHAFGLALDGSYDFDLSELQGRQARALLGVEVREKVKDGRTYQNEVNVVEALYTEKHPEPAEIPAAKAPAAPRASTPEPSVSKGAMSGAVQQVFGGAKKQGVPF